MCIRDRITDLRSTAKDGKLDAEGEKQQSELEAKVSAARTKMTDIISEYASKQPLVSQLIDLALLGNGLLRGAALNDFITRSVSLL